MASTKKQFLKNSVWTFVDLALFPILVIIATPIFISKLGIEQYGLWMLVGTVTLIINLLNFGIGDSVIKLISQYRATNNQEMIQHTFGCNFSLSLLLFTASIIVGALFYYFEVISFFYNTFNYKLANTIVFLSCISLGLKFIEIVFLSVFKGFERFDISAKLSLLSKNSVVIVNILMVYFGNSLETIVWTTLIINILNILLQYHTLKYIHKHILDDCLVNVFNNQNLIWQHNFWYWLQSSIALIGFLSDKLLVARLTDTKTYGYYYIASMLCTNIHNVLLSFGNFSFPRVSYKLASQKNIYGLYIFSRATLTMLGWSICFGLIVFGDFFFKIWLGSETYSKSIFYIKLYLVYEAVMLMIIVPFQFVNGSKFIWLNSLFEILIRSSHIIAMIAGNYLYGINGILYGLIIASIVNIPFQYYKLHQLVIKKQLTLNHIKIITPLLFLFFIPIFDSWISTTILSTLFIISTKLIYFDEGKKYYYAVFKKNKNYTVSKYSILSFVYFFFNSVIVPKGLLFTTILSPFSYLNQIIKKTKCISKTIFSFSSVI